MVEHSIHIRGVVGSNPAESTMKMKVSCVILAKNEEKNIERAIQSVKFVDEVIVIDDESIDQSVLIAQSAGAKVISRKLNGDFAQARNFAMEKAEGEWILFLDGDEVVTEELKNEIIQLTIDNRLLSKGCFYIKRRDIFWGRELRFGETKKARNKGIIRLVKKDSGHFVGVVHETYKSDLSIGILDGYLNHYPHPTVSAFLADINLYSSLRANELKAQKVRANILQIIFFPFFKFIYTYIILLGALDGAAGFVYSFMMSFHSFLVRAKLYLMKHET